MLNKNINDTGNKKLHQFMKIKIKQNNKYKE